MASSPTLQGSPSRSNSWKACSSSWTSSRLLSPQRTTQSPASRNFPKVAAKPFLALTPPPGAHRAMLGSGALRGLTPPPPQPGPLLPLPHALALPSPSLSIAQFNNVFKLSQVLKDKKWFAGEEGHSGLSVQDMQRLRGEKNRMNLGNGEYLQGQRITFARGG